MSLRNDNIDVEITSVKQITEPPLRGYDVLVTIAGKQRNLILTETPVGSFFIERVADALLPARLSRTKQTFIETRESELERELPPAVPKPKIREANHLVFTLLQRRNERTRAILLAEALADPKAFRDNYADELDER